MLERRMRRMLGDSWGRLAQERLGPWWRVWGMLKEEIAPRLTGALCWKEEAWAACLQVLAERSRRRTVHQLPPEVIAVFYRCDDSQQAGLPLAAERCAIKENPCLSWRLWGRSSRVPRPEPTGLDGALLTCDCPGSGGYFRPEVPGSETCASTSAATGWCAGCTARSPNATMPTSCLRRFRTGKRRIW